MKCFPHASLLSPLLPPSLPLPSLWPSKAFLVGLAVSCCRGKKSVIEGEVEADDSDVSDDEYVHWSEASSLAWLKEDCKVLFFFFHPPRQTSEGKPAGSQLTHCFRGVLTLPWCPVGWSRVLTRHNETDWLLRRPHSILLMTPALSQRRSISAQGSLVQKILKKKQKNKTWPLNLFTNWRLHSRL